MYRGEIWLGEKHGVCGVCMNGEGGNLHIQGNGNEQNRKETFSKFCIGKQRKLEKEDWYKRDFQVIGNERGLFWFLQIFAQEGGGRLVYKYCFKTQGGCFGMYLYGFNGENERVSNVFLISNGYFEDIESMEVGHVRKLKEGKEWHAPEIEKGQA
jgi:hypothetical protein